MGGMTGRPRSEQYSDALHAAVVARLLDEPDTVLADARARLRRHLDLHEGSSASALLQRWEGVLEEGVDAVVAVLTSGSADDRRLRQASPFAGLLSPQERWALMKQVRDAA